MHSAFISKVMRNALWLSLAIVSGAVLERFIFTIGHSSMGMPEGVALGLIVMATTILTEYLLPHNSDSASPFKQSMALTLAASIALSVAAQTQNAFVIHSDSITASLFLFAILRTAAAYITGRSALPEWLRTRVLVLGDGPEADKISELVRKNNGRYVLCPSTPGFGKNACRNASHLSVQASRMGASRIIVCFPERRGVMPMQDILDCRLQGMEVTHAQDFYEELSRKLYIERLTPSCLIFSSRFGLTPAKRVVKRCLDASLAFIGLVLSAPLLVIVGLAVNLDSPGPVLFRQTRTGRGGRPFSIIKFRTMREDAENATGAVWASRKDPRITRIGRFLRKTRLDELPQLINVLRGDMSLVGPRPERPEFIKDLEKHIPFYSVRHCVKPGVTGWAQVSYPYGSSVEDALEKLRYDLFYIKNQSVRLELEILLKTILVVFTGHGAR